MYFFKVCIFIILLFGLNHSAIATENVVAEEYINQVKSMKSYEIYQEFVKNQALIKIKQQNQSTNSIWLDPNDIDVKKSMALISVLQARRDNNDSSSSYYYGLYELQICVAVKNVDTTHDICKSAMKSFKVAVNDNDPRVMRMIGLMYKDGLGVEASKYVAVDWLLKAAKEYRIENIREGALRALEEALNLLPDHPETLKFRNELLQ